MHRHRGKLCKETKSCKANIQFPFSIGCPLLTTHKMFPLFSPIVAMSVYTDEHVLCSGISALLLQFGSQTFWQTGWGGVELSRCRHAWHGMEVGNLIGMSPHSQLRFQGGKTVGRFLWLIDASFLRGK